LPVSSIVFKTVTMSETYSIHKEIVQDLFKNILAPDNFKHINNYHHVKDILLRELSDSNIEIITTLLLKNKEYKAVQIGDYVKVKPPKYHKGSEYEEDVLIDMGLMREEDTNTVYGVVTDDGSWSSSEEFNPFYSSIKIDLLYHDTQKQLKTHEVSLNPMQIKKVSKGHIKYFKDKSQLSLKITEDA